MSQKLGMILSVMFIILVFLFGADLVMLQTVYTNLDSISETISFQIAKNGVDSDGDIDSSIKDYVYKTTGASITANNNGKVNFLEGDIFAYVLTKEYQPILLSTNPIKVSVSRYTVLGINHS